MGLKAEGRRGRELKIHDPQKPELRNPKNPIPNLKSPMTNDR
jgi:hypothetical protein